MSKLAEIIKFIRNGVSHLKMYAKNVCDAGATNIYFFVLILTYTTFAIICSRNDTPTNAEIFNVLIREASVAE